MTNQAVLEKAIRLAIDGGWDRSVALNWKLLFAEAEQQEDFKSHIYGGLIFNHEFCKALWGESECVARGRHRDRGVCLDNHANWQYHLQMMVISDDPIKYLGENLLLEDRCAKS